MRMMTNHDHNSDSDNHDASKTQGGAIPSKHTLSQRNG